MITKLKNWLSVRHNVLELIFVASLLIGYVLVAWGGIGNNWDGTFPYFSRHFSTFPKLELSAWQYAGLGAPLGYASSTPFPLLTYLISRLTVTPELTQIVIHLLFFISIYLAGRLIISKLFPAQRLIAVLVSLLFIFNPAIFYKFLAGHWGYIFSYSAYLWLVSLLLSTKVFSTRTVVGLMLLAWLTTVQIQFFIFTPLTLLIWLFLNYTRDRLKIILSAFGAMLLLNCYWLLPILFGANSVDSLRSNAAVNSFTDLGRTNFLRIFTLWFSPATFIDKFFGAPSALFGILFFTLVIWGVFKRTYTERKIVLYFLIGLFSFVILTSGYYASIPIPVISYFYPMLREAGHAAPLLVVFLLLAIVGLWATRRTLVTILLFSYLALSYPLFLRGLPKVSFSDARASLQSYEDFLQQKEDSSRVLVYPFFNQYSLIDQPVRVINNTPLSNSGWDSFSIFSGSGYIQNSVSPIDFQDSLQRKFLERYDLELLRQKNVGYILDLSSVYASNFDKFSDPAVYGNDVSLIHTDKDFIAKVVKANPDGLAQVSPNIYRVVGAESRITGPTLTFVKESETLYRVDVTIRDYTKFSLNFLESFHYGWKIGSGTAISCEVVSVNQEITECASSNRLITWPEFKQPSFFEQSHTIYKDFGNRWEVDPELIRSRSPGSVRSNPDGTITVSLSIYYQPQNYYLVGMLLSALALALLLFGLLKSPRISPRKVVD